MNFIELSVDSRVGLTQRVDSKGLEGNRTSEVSNIKLPRPTVA